MTTAMNTAAADFATVRRARIADRFLARYEGDVLDAMRGLLACGDLVDEDDVDTLLDADLVMFNIEEGDWVLTMKGEDVRDALADVETAESI